MVKYLREVIYMSKALDFYKNEIINKEKEIKSLNNIINIISIVRLAIVILTIGSWVLFLQRRKYSVFNFICYFGLFIIYYCSYFS